MELARVYSTGRKAAKAHLLDPSDSPNDYCPALCILARPQVGRLWMGTGSQAERDEAAGRELCRPCLKAAKYAGYLTDPEHDPFDLTIDTVLGDVDLIAIERAMQGHRVQLSEAEEDYLMRKLIADLIAKPPREEAHLRRAGRKGDQYAVGLDPRYTLVGAALGVQPSTIEERATARIKREARRLAGDSS